MYVELSIETLDLARGLLAAAWDSARLPGDDDSRPHVEALHAAMLEVDRLVNTHYHHQTLLNHGAWCDLDTMRRGRVVENLGIAQVVQCIDCTRGWSVGKYQELPLEARNAVATWCPSCGGGIDYRDREIPLGRYHLCCIATCMQPGSARDSLGAYAGVYCDEHYETDFPLRKEGKEGFSPLDAGEEW